MRTALEADPQKLDEHERDFVSIVREHGWHQMNVWGEEEAPGFSYTTGFWLLGFPEIIVFSMERENASAVLWSMYNAQKSGEAYPMNTPVCDILTNVPVCLLPVDRQRYAEYLGWSRWFYGNDTFPCLQLVWPSREGVFPWHPGFPTDLAEHQPDLSEAAWAGLRKQS